jgi:hypothetical protein
VIQAVADFESNDVAVRCSNGAVIHSEVNFETMLEKSMMADQGTV